MADGDGAQLEVEWQFNAVDVRPVARWLEAYQPDGISVVHAKERRLSDAYFDTSGWSIHRAGYTCRLRWDGSHGELTLKSMAEAEDGIRRREEINQRVADPDPARFINEDGPATDLLVPIAGRTPLRLLFALETERQVYHLADSEGQFGEVALDTTTIPVGEEDHPVRMSRVEVEVDSAAVERARPFVDRLAQETSLSVAGTSKFEAALLATGQHPDPLVPDLGQTAIHADLTIGELAFAVLREQLIAVLQNEAGTRLGRDIEALHDMRVAARRMRAAFSTFREYLSPTARAIESEVKWLQQTLGPVRDLDVQIERLQARMDQPDVDAEGLQQYMDVLGTRREQARKRMLLALDSKRYVRLGTRLVGILQRGPARTYSPGRVPAPIVGMEVIAKRYGKLRKKGDRIRKSSPPTEYHALRIQGKKLRYAVEFFAPLYGKRADGYIEDVKKLQDVLGDHQDSEVAMETLRDHAAVNRRLHGRTVLAMGALAESYRLDAERLRAEFPAVYRQVRGGSWKKLGARMEKRASSYSDPLPKPPKSPHGEPSASSRGPESSNFGEAGDESVDTVSGGR